MQNKNTEQEMLQKKVDVLQEVMAMAHQNFQKLTRKEEEGKMDDLEHQLNKI